MFDRQESEEPIEWPSHVLFLLESAAKLADLRETLEGLPADLPGVRKLGKTLGEEAGRLWALAGREFLEKPYGGSDTQRMRKRRDAEPIRKRVQARPAKGGQTPKAKAAT